MKLEGYVDEILAGGFPGMRGRPWRALVAQLNGYLERIVDHDLPEAGCGGACPTLEKVATAVGGDLVVGVGVDLSENRSIAKLVREGRAVVRRAS